MLPQGLAAGHIKPNAKSRIQFLGPKMRGWMEVLGQRGFHIFVPCRGANKTGLELNQPVPSLCGNISSSKS